MIDIISEAIEMKERLPLHHPHPEPKQVSTENLLFTNPLEWEEITHEVENLVLNNNYERAAQILNLPDPKTATPDEIGRVMYQQQNIHYLTMAGRLNAEELDEEAFILIREEWDRQLNLLRYPDLSPNVTYEESERPWIEEMANKACEFGLVAKNPTYYQECLKNPGKLKHWVDEEENRLERVEIAKELGLYNEQPTWEHIMRRLLDLPLSASREKVVDRFQKIYPSIQETVIERGASQ